MIENRTIERLWYISNLAQRAVDVGVISVEDLEKLFEDDSSTLDSIYTSLERMMTQEISNATFMTNIGVVRLCR